MDHASTKGFDRQRAARQIQASLPQGPLRTMLMAATLAGAAVPSQTLERLGITIPFDWRTLNRFSAAYPIAIASLEAGHGA
jgi:type II restriction/modification system DNA methylase subunit YeeA